MRHVTLSILAVFLAIPFSRAQTNPSISPTVINIAGGTYNNPASYFRADWSVGELSLVHTATSNTVAYVITNGFLQPYENNFDVNSNLQFGPEEIRVFPNPANSYVEIDFRTKQKGKMQFRLYDQVGQLLYKQEFLSYGLDRIEKINMDRFAQGAYLLHIELVPDPGSVHKKGSYQILKLR